MCGIAAIVAPNPEWNAPALHRMVDSLSHRGPDGMGTHFFPECAMGHTRLSIVDLITGDQPMISPVTGCGIIFNGEIYGYREIRNTIKGYPFRTTSDTEVILALYDRLGPDCVTRLPGMFAFAVWDHRNRELFCARDRFGEKPMYYAFGDKGEFLIGSEIKALIRSGLVRPAICRESIAEYLKWLYIPPDRTVYKNIFTLPPAHSLVFRGGKIHIKRYWNLPEPSEKITLQDAAVRFQDLFSQAVSRQLVADVPVGAFLSGGIDSSTIVAVASGFQPGLKTFSFGFEDSASELPFARLVADRYRTEHVELETPREDLGDLLLKMQEVYDEPFADSSNIPTYLISREAKKHLKVILTGDGGDELLGGYTYWYRPLFHHGNPIFRNRSMKTILMGLLKICDLISKRKSERRDHLLNYLYLSRNFGTIRDIHSAQQRYFTDDQLRDLGLEPPCRDPIDSTMPPSDTLEDALRMDISCYMPGDILVKIDRASMANGLELRAPFLDVDLASFCLSLPYTLKIDALTDKILVRKAFEETWPRPIRERKKMGFGAPVDRWLKYPSVNALAVEFLKDERKKIFSLLSFPAVQSYLGRDDYHSWALLVLSLWLETYDFEIG